MKKAMCAMSTPNQPEPYPSQPYQPPAAQNPYPNQPAPYQGYPAQQPAYPGYPQAGYGAVDPSAPFGRDPVTGEPLSDKSAVVAGLLQLFFGTLGVGRFYIGSTTIGALQLGATVLSGILCFLLIGFFLLPCVGIWAFIDAIMIFTGSVKDINGRKLRSGA
jgi:TM2 domain-containing membrane protein YozV